MIVGGGGVARCRVGRKQPARDGGCSALFMEFIER